MNPIIEVLKKEIQDLNPNNPDYNSGFNDGAYRLWAYLFEPHSIPEEIRDRIKKAILGENQ